VTDPGSRGVRLLDKIQETLGEDWLQMGGIRGEEKQFAVRYDHVVSLVVGIPWYCKIFYQRPSDGELLCIVIGGGRWAEGSWVTGEFDIHAFGPLGEPIDN
jgi:hypothetical protein